MNALPIVETQVNKSSFLSERTVLLLQERMLWFRQPGRHVTFYEDVCADFARIRARDELGGWDKVTIWEVTEVNL